MSCSCRGVGWRPLFGVPGLVIGSSALCADSTRGYGTEPVRNRSPLDGAAEFDGQQRAKCMVRDMNETWTGKLTSYLVGGGCGLGSRGNAGAPAPVDAVLSATRGGRALPKPILLTAAVQQLMAELLWQRLKFWFLCFNKHEIHDFFVKSTPTPHTHKNSR